MSVLSESYSFLSVLTKKSVDVELKNASSLENGVIYQTKRPLKSFFEKSMIVSTLSSLYPYTVLSFLVKKNNELNVTFKPLKSNAAIVGYFFDSKRITIPEINVYYEWRKL